VEDRTIVLEQCTTDKMVADERVYLLRVYLLQPKRLYLLQP
jgi:hypothetical protein